MRHSTFPELDAFYCRAYIGILGRCLGDDTFGNQKSDSLALGRREERQENMVGLFQSPVGFLRETLAFSRGMRISVQCE
jgi:hypothetical protein